MMISTSFTSRKTTEELGKKSMNKGKLPDKQNILKRHYQEIV